MHKNIRCSALDPRLMNIANAQWRTHANAFQSILLWLRHWLCRPVTV